MNDQVKEYDMRRECSMIWAEEEYIYDFGGKARRKGTTMKV
jgi:hypothetical protein